MAIIEVRALPDAVRSALDLLGYHRKDIQIKAAESASLNDAGADGCRAFVCIVDLTTGKRAATYGSWGGPNMFNPTNAVDLDSRPQPIPLGAVVIRGSEGGGRPVYASLLTHPATLAPLLPAPCELDERLRRILAVYDGIKAGPYRKEYLQRAGATSADADLLVAGGYLTRNKAGAVTITTKGKQACDGVRVS